MKTSLTPNFLSLYEAETSKINTIKIDFYKKYQQKHSQKIMSIFILVVFIINMITAGNLLLAIPVSACHGDITIIKETDVVTTESFNFNGDLGNFNLIQNGQKVFTHRPGDKIYNINEIQTNNWELLDITCTGEEHNNTVIDIINHSVSIELDNNEQIVCTFHNKHITPKPICGNNIIEEDEICDAGELNNIACQADYGGTCSYCNNSCQLTEIIGEYCGDNIVNGSEECDGQNGINENQSCSETCEIINTEHCGDGIINNDELCDNGDNNGLVCQADYGGTCSYCSDTCSLVELTGEYCGDNIVNGSEECDGQNGINENQSCSETCEIINIPPHESICGNGIIETNEACDDGDNNGHEGYCDIDCQSATVYGGGGGGSYSPPEKIIVLAETGAPYLNIGKIINRQYTENNKIKVEYTIFLSNDGNLTAFNVQLTDKLPTDMYFDDDNTSSRNWSIGDMPAGDIESFHYLTYIATDTKQSDFNNIATAQADNYNPISATAILHINQPSKQASNTNTDTPVNILPETGFNANEMLMLILVAMFSLGTINIIKKQNI